MPTIEEIHVYILMNGWKYHVGHLGGVWYSAPYPTRSLIFGRTAAYRTQQKNERGEDCGNE
jgi:hypothetical protein